MFSALLAAGLMFLLVVLANRTEGWGFGYETVEEDGEVISQHTLSLSKICYGAAVIVGILYVLF